MQSFQNDSMERKKLILNLFILFAVIYYAARVAIFYAGFTGSMEFEEEQSGLVENIVIYSFLAIGVVGLLLLPGVYLLMSWGFWGTIAVSAYTIVFDLAALLVIQPSAGAGIVPAAVIMVYLLSTRSDFIGTR